MEKRLSLINDDLMTLSTEAEGLRWMVYTVSKSVDCFTVKESEKEKLDRIAVTFPAIISSLDTIIRKLDTITNELDDFDMHMDSTTNVSGIASLACDNCEKAQSASDQGKLDAECSECPLNEIMESR